MPDDISQIDVDEFLAHFGVKGMRWGVRRNNPTTTGSLADHITNKTAKVGEVKVQKDPVTGEVRSVIKRADGKWEKVEPSEQATKFVEAHKKSGAELSDNELRDAVARARLVKEYDQLFQGPDASKELKKQVEDMKTQKEYKKLYLESNPTAGMKVAALAASAGTAFVAYQKINKATGGQLSKQLAGAIGIKSTGGKHKLI